MGQLTIGVLLIKHILHLITITNREKRLCPYLISFSHFAPQDESQQCGRTLLSSASQGYSGTSLDLVSGRICNYTENYNYKNNFLHIDGWFMGYEFLVN